MARFDMTSGTLRSVVFLFVFALILGAANLLFTAHAVSTSSHRWCATLTLLSAHPVPKPADPEANPSRENAYLFYADILDLRHRFGCG